MEVILKQEEKPIVDEMKKFLESLTVEEQREINIFIQGIRFARNITEKGPAA